MSVNSQSIKSMSEHELLELIDSTKRSWQTLNNNFNHITDCSEIDCCIYTLKALEMKYGLLLREAKEKGLSLPAVR